MIFELLRQGKENAITGKRICHILGIQDREMRKRVLLERRAGKPICSSSGFTKGYYIAKDRAEMRRFCKELYHRANEITATGAACERAIRKLPVKSV